MTVDEIEQTFYNALKADTYARGDADITSICMTCLTVTRKLQNKGVENTNIAEALINLGNKKNWKLLTTMGKSMTENLKQLSETITNSIIIVSNNVENK